MSSIKKVGELPTYMQEAAQELYEAAIRYRSIYNANVSADHGKIMLRNDETKDVILIVDETYERSAVDFCMGVNQ